MDYAKAVDQVEEQVSDVEAAIHVAREALLPHREFFNAPKIDTISETLPQHLRDKTAKVLERVFMKYSSAADFIAKTDPSGSS